MHLWSRDLFTTYRRLLRENTAAQRNFIRALKPLQKPQIKNPTQTTRTAAQTRPHLQRSVTVFRQTASISIVDGKTVTHVPDFPAAAILKRGPLRQTRAL